MIDEIQKLLIHENLRICVAESVTGGNLQNELTNISGSSMYFDGGVTAYTLEQKVKLLNVDKYRAEMVNSVSIYVANQMAIGACEMFGSDISIAVTGYSEIYGKETPHIFYAIYYKGNIVDNGRIESIFEDRIINKKSYTNLLLKKLLHFLQEICTK